MSQPDAAVRRKTQCCVSICLDSEIKKLVVVSTYCVNKYKDACMHIQYAQKRLP